MRFPPHSFSSRETEPSNCRCETVPRHRLGVRARVCACTCVRACVCDRDGPRRPSAAQRCHRPPSYLSAPCPGGTEPHESQGRRRHRQSPPPPAAPTQAACPVSLRRNEWNLRKHKTMLTNGATVTKIVRRHSTHPGARPTKAGERERGRGRGRGGGGGGGVRERERRAGWTRALTHTHTDRRECHTARGIRHTVRDRLSATHSAGYATLRAHTQFKHSHTISQTQWSVISAPRVVSGTQCRGIPWRSATPRRGMRGTLVTHFLLPWPIRSVSLPPFLPARPSAASSSFFLTHNFSLILSLTHTHEPYRFSTTSRLDSLSSTLTKHPRRGLLSGRRTSFWLAGLACVVIVVLPSEPVRIQERGEAIGKYV